MYPVTSTGRMVAAALMMSGIAVLGVVTASIASQNSRTAAGFNIGPPQRVVTTGALSRCRVLPKYSAEIFG